MTTLAATPSQAAILPRKDWLTPTGRRLLNRLYKVFVEWQSYRVLSEMRDDQLNSIGGNRARSGRVAAG